MNDSDTEFVLQESFENELDSDAKPFNLLLPEITIMLLKFQLLKKLWKKVLAKPRRT